MTETTGIQKGGVEIDVDQPELKKPVTQRTWGGKREKRIGPFHGLHGKE